MPFLSERVQRIKPSPTMAITAKAKEMKAQGIDLIGFGAGEPDFDTPDNIKAAAIKAIEAGFTKYTPSGGTVELKDAVIHSLKTTASLDYKRENILISCGGKHSLYNIFQAVIDPGDEVVIPAPYWVSYPDMVLLAGGTPVFVNCPEEANFKMTPAQLEEALTERTKIIVINSPSNPTGTAYGKEELEALARIAVKNNILVISDEIYSLTTYGDFECVSIASLGEEIKKLTLLSSGVSKSYSMPGWRIGYTAGDPEIIKAMDNIQGQSTSNPTSISQAAAVEALTGPQESVAEMKRHFEKRKNFIVERLNALPGVSCFDPQGAFYVFPRVSAFYEKSWKGETIGGSLGLTRFLMEEAKVAVVPGEPFGADEHIRLSYATSMENIEEGLKRIEKALKSL